MTVFLEYSHLSSSGLPKFAKPAWLKICRKVNRLSPHHMFGRKARKQVMFGSDIMSKSDSGRVRRPNARKALELDRGSSLSRHPGPSIQWGLQKGIHPASNVPEYP